MARSVVRARDRREEGEVGAQGQAEDRFIAGPEGESERTVAFDGPSRAPASGLEESLDLLPTVRFDDGGAVHVGDVRVLEAVAQFEKSGDRGALFGEGCIGIVDGGGGGRAALGVAQAILKEFDALPV